MSRVLHVSVNIEGLLANKRRIRGIVDTATGKELDDMGARQLLLAEYAKGIRQMPIGEPCEGFSYETGCPGHDEV